MFIIIIIRTLGKMQMSSCVSYGVITIRQQTSGAIGYK